MTSYQEKMSKLTIILCVVLVGLAVNAIDPANQDEEKIELAEELPKTDKADKSRLLNRLAKLWKSADAADTSNINIRKKIIMEEFEKEFKVAGIHKPFVELQEYEAFLKASMEQINDYSTSNTKKPEIKGRVLPDKYVKMCFDDKYSPVDCIDLIRISYETYTAINKSNAMGKGQPKAAATHS